MFEHRLVVDVQGQGSTVVFVSLPEREIPKQGQGEGHAPTLRQKVAFCWGKVVESQLVSVTV